MRPLAPPEAPVFRAEEGSPGAAPKVFPAEAEQVSGNCERDAGLRLQPPPVAFRIAWKAVLHSRPAVQR
jgi:hypothetical protein